MDLYRLLKIVVVVSIFWTVGNWIGDHETIQKIVPTDDRKLSIRDQSAGHEVSDRSQIGYVHIGAVGEAKSNAVITANTPSENPTIGFDRRITRQENLALSDPASSLRQPVSLGKAPDWQDDDEPTDDEETLSISGWVQNDTGEPMVGIQVAASARQLFTQEDGEPSVSQTPQTATTNDEGYFELLELADGEYSVSTLATPEFKSAMAILRAGVDSAVLVIKNDARHEVNVNGTISSSQGQPLAGVRVRAPGAKGVASSGEDGSYKLALSIHDREQSYSVRFTKKGYRPESLQLGIAALDDGGEVTLDAKLEPVEETAMVDGTVWDLTGSAIPDARIRLSSSQLQRTYLTRSDQAGVFSYPEVDVGDDYRLWVRPQSDYEEYIQEPIVVAADGTNLPVTLEPLESGALKGHMVDADGTPVPGFSLWLRTASPSAQQHRMVTSDQQGQFKVDDLPEGEVSFSTRSAPYFQVTGMHFSPGDQERVELWLDLGIYEVSGYVLDANGDPVAGSRVSLNWVISEGELRSRSKRTTATDATGLFLFTQIGSGWHVLSVDAPGYRPTRLDHYVSSSDDVIVRLMEDPS